MVLANGLHRQAVDFVGASRLQLDEFDSRAELAEVDRETRIGLLTNENVAHPLVTAVDANHVAGDVRRREKREPHDVIPMRMRQENVEARLLRRAMLRDQRVAELAHAGADVAQHILVATRFNLDATRVAAVGAADGERQLIYDEGVDRLGTLRA